MLIRTNELTGPALDWAVAKCENAQGWKPFYPDPAEGYGRGPVYTPHPYSTNWSQGGPIIEREGIGLVPPFDDDDGLVWASALRRTAFSYGSAPLVAAMRCYVASKLGDEVDVPVELL